MSAPIAKPKEGYYSGKSYLQQAYECPCCGVMFWTKARVKPSPLPIPMYCERCYKREARRAGANEYNQRNKGKYAASSKAWRHDPINKGRIDEYKRKYLSKPEVKKRRAAKARQKRAVHSFFTRFMPPGRLGEESAKKRVRR